jgi:transposase
MARIKEREGISGRRLRQEKRRLEASELFALGRSRADVSKELKVSWGSVHKWYTAWKSEGERGLVSEKRPGPARKFTDEDAVWLRQQLELGPKAHGYCNELWTVPRIQRLLAEKLGKPCSGSEAWRLLQRIGYSSQKPVRRARERKPEAIEQWKKETWPALCKQAKEEKRQIVFVDESGLSLKPVRQASFAPRGEPLVLEFNFNWDKLSAIGAVSTSEIYFCLHEESIKSEQVIAFVNHLHAEIGKPLLIIWDGLRAHWSKAVKAHIETFAGKILVKQLPAYAPELNPVEYLWSHLKRNDLANFAAKNLEELSQVSRAAVAKIQPVRKKYLHAFWIQTELDLSEL